MVCSGFSDLFYCLNWTVRFFFSPTNNFYSPTPNFEKFTFIFTRTALCSVYLWGRLRTYPRSQAVILAPDLWSPRTRKWPIATFQRKCRITNMDTQTDEKMKAQTTRQTAGKKIISKWFKFYQWNSMKWHSHRASWRNRKQTFTFNSIPEILSLAGAVEWPHSVCTIGATLGTIITIQSTLVNIWKQQKDIDKRPGGMDNT